MTDLTPQEITTIKTMRAVGLSSLSLKELQTIKLIRAEPFLPYHKATINVKQNGGWTVRITREKQAEFD